jgi:hypothetical protein
MQTADSNPPAAPDESETTAHVADWLADFKAACATLPEKVELPYALTPEGERLAMFKRVCPQEFFCKVVRERLPNPAAFDAVALWNGNYPGPCATGKTDTAKTRAAWSALGRLYVKDNRPFAWFPVRRLVTEFDRYEKHDVADEFFRAYSHYKALFVDDIDKIGAQFDTAKEQLFAFYDWVYRTNKPCITTTNKGRAWWVDRMGEAFARRLFEDAHFEVQF